MSYYKDKVIGLGYSDIASLVMVGVDMREVTGLRASFLNMGKDGNYRAYVIKNDEVEVPEHYSLTDKFVSWLKIYDDDSLVATFEGKEIEVYQAGMMGILIRVLED